jgi:prepilin-type N-terminal cleavage/methylation domain-containing protein
MRDRHAFDERGFSLIETLVAASILATALSALTQLLVITSAVTDDTGRMTMATLLASQKIEDLRASSSVALEGDGSDAPAAGFVRQWSFSALPSDPDHVVVIEVVVTTRGSTTRLISLRTIEP